MMKHTFEIEHWPDPFGKHTLTRLIKGFIKGWLLLSAITIVLFGLYFFTRLNWFRYLTMGFVFVLVTSPLLPILSFLQRDKKNPSYGINKEGFLLNERGWNSAYFKWDEIKSIKEFNDPKFGRELHIEFVSYTKAINKPGQDKFQQSLAREYEIEKQPKKISGQLVKGDVGPFIDKFIQHYNDYKRKNPDLDQAGALELAKTYAAEHNYEFDFSQVHCERKEEFMNLKKPVWLIVANKNTMVVEVFTKKIPFVVDQDGKKVFPHMS